MQPTRSRRFGAWLVLVAAFLGMAVLGAAEVPLPGERATIERVQEAGGVGDIARFLRDAAHDWNPLVLLILGAIALLKGYPGLATIIVLLWPARLLNAGAKIIVDRPRPGADLAIDGIPTTNGFPSGHAFAATALAIALVLLCYRLGGPRAGALAAVPAVLFLVAAGLARLWLGVHWPLDILGGMLLAVILAAVLVAMEPAIDRVLGGRWRKRAAAA